MQTLLIFCSTQATAQECVETCHHRWHSFTITAPFIFPCAVYLCDSSLIRYIGEKSQNRCVELNLCIYIGVTFWQSDRAPYAVARCQPPSESVCRSLRNSVQHKPPTKSTTISAPPTFICWPAFITCHTSSHSPAASHALKGAARNTHK